MAPRGDAKIFFCILFVACCCCTATFAQTLVDCCLEVARKPIPRNMVVDYEVQSSQRGCALDATILLTRGQKKLCAPAEGPWVERVRKHVDHQKKECKKKNYTGKQCVGVPRE